MGLAAVRTGPPDVILLDLRLPDQSGLEVYEQIRRLDAHSGHLHHGGQGRRRSHRGDEAWALRLPVQAARSTNCDAWSMRRCSTWSSGCANRPSLREDLPDPDVEGAILGGCPAMREVYKAIGHVAGQDVTVLITGESGTGKELVARAIYQHGSRAQAPSWLSTRAPSPKTLLESELFGHEKGAFTGADRRRIGKFEQCNRGTIFLDEVGDMPLAVQAKLLRVLQEQSFERIGGNETVRTDDRLIAATHRDLKAWLEEGRFRPDLYYRLSAFTIDLPPLRQRGDDLPMLVRHYLCRLGRELGREVLEVSPRAIDRLRDYSWPGNIRELQNVLRQAVLRTRGQVLFPEFLPELSQGPDRLGANVEGPAASGSPDLESFIRRELAAGTAGLHEETHRWVDRIFLPMVLEHTKGNQRQAAAILGIARKTLRDRLRELGITIQRSLDLGDGDDG